MTRTDADKQRTIDRLTQAAVEDQHGNRLVRRCIAIEIMGVSHQRLDSWVRDGLVRMTRVKVNRPIKRGWRGQVSRRSTPRGFLTVLNLTDLHERIEVYRTCVRWSRSDDDYVLEKLGALGYQTIARNLGRTAQAVSDRATKHLGVGVLSNSGLILTTDFGRMVDRSSSAVYEWCKRGMPHRLTDSTRPHRLIDSRKAARWLLNTRQRHILRKLSAQACDRVRALASAGLKTGRAAA